MNNTTSETNETVSVLDEAYELYKADWCKARGFDLEEVEKANAEDSEYHGQMFVCKDEFEDCEFQDMEYLAYLFGDRFAEIKKQI